MQSVRVLLIADDPLVRAALASVLADAEACQLVGQAPADDQLLASLNLFQPDVVLWDLGWQPAPDIELLAEFAALAPSLVVLLDDAEIARATLTAGARGILPRQISSEQIEAALTAAAHDLMIVATEFAAQITTTPSAELDVPVEALTAREMDVLQLLAEGAANKAIARRLGISENTVKYHVNAILGKLDAQSRTEAVVRATRAGLILL